MTVIGLISDTHNLLRSDIHTALAGVSRILHAGDVGDPEILLELNLIAPVTAVYGNTDDRLELKLPGAIDIVIDGVRVHVSHGHELGRPKPAQLAEAYDAHVIVYGHTHIQLIERIGAKLVINPGAAGARRFNLLPSVARLTIENGAASAELISLSV